MLKDMLKLLANVNTDVLEYLIGNNITLLNYPQTSGWIRDNKPLLSMLYVLERKPDIDKLLEDSKLHSPRTYQILSTFKGRAWLHLNVQELDQFLR